jgi:hypothetical protein
MCRCHCGPSVTGCPPIASSRCPSGLHLPAVPPNSPPPLLVRPHPGPTSQTRPRLDPEVQFFTSRGFAVADVDYRCSTGPSSWPTASTTPSYQQLPFKPLPTPCASEARLTSRACLRTRGIPQVDRRIGGHAASRIRLLSGSFRRRARAGHSPHHLGPARS